MISLTWFAKTQSRDSDLGQYRGLTSSQLSTLICVFTLDRIGRRWTLYWGAVGQGVIVIIAGGLAYATNNAADGTTYKTQTGGATVACVFIFTMIFGATWLTVPWLYPAE